MRGSIFVVAISFLALAACGQDAKLVNEPPLDVVNRLGSMPSNADVMYLAKQVPHASFRSQTGAEGVDWTFSIGGHDICRFSAKVVEAGAGTGASRVSTSIERLGEQKEDYLCSIARITGEESVAATLEKRPANVEAVNEQLKQYLLNNMGEVQEMVSRRMDEMAPPKGDECKSGDATAQANCRKFMKMREKEMEEQGFARP